MSFVGAFVSDLFIQTAVYNSSTNDARHDRLKFR
jgi:hypothetical protein